MKEKIYTIPVNEAFKEKKGCPFCTMYDTLDRNAITYMLGPSYMEDDIRMDTNKMGFCQRHYQSLYDGQNRLGLSLLLHTHIQQINKDLRSLTDDMGASQKRKLFFQKDVTADSPKALEYLQVIESSCYICNKVSNTFEQFVDTFFYMWKKDGDMKALVKESSGFCIAHFRVLLQEGKKKLNPEAYKEFLSVVVPLQTESLKALEDDLDWFIQKFDYRNNDAPWKNAKDALPRALHKIASINVE